MKRHVIAAVLAAAPGSFAFAADGWAGPYAGLRLGMETYSSQFVDIDDEYDNQGVNGDSSAAFTPGILAGWNFETDGLVYGAEVSYDFNGGDSSSKPYGAANVALMQTELKSILALKGRAGIASGSNLGYVTAGFVSAKVDSTFNTGTGDESYSDSVSGLTYGVGVEHKFTDMLVGRLQVDATDLETTDPATVVNGNHLSSTNSLNSFSVAVTYKF